MAHPTEPVLSWIRSHAENRPEHPALIAGKDQLSYRQLWVRITAAAAWIARQGVTKGDRVLVRVDSRDPLFAIAYFGTHLAGGVAVPVDFRADPVDISERQRFSDARLVLFGDVHSSFAESSVSTTASDDSALSSELPGLSDLAEIMFTSGSTGQPKGVTLSHRNITESACMIQDYVGNAADDVEVVTVPMTHSFGLGRLRATMRAGGTLVVVPGLAFPQLTINALQQHRATGLACVPSGMRLLVSRFRDALAALSDRLRYLEMGSAPFMADEKRALCELLPKTRLCMHYGLTEASRSAFTEFHADHEKLDSVGQPSPGVEVRIEPQPGHDDHPQSIGLIHIRAPTVMAGYWKDDERTADVLDRDSGWFNSGDLGWMDRDGYLYFSGRADDVINCGGVNILPDDIERVAIGFPGVQDCGCIGVSDPNGILGEVPLLCVVAPDADISTLGEHVRNRLAHDIAGIEVRKVSAIPRTDSGKLLRRKLRDAATPEVPSGPSDPP